MSERLKILAEAAFMALPRKRRYCSWRDLQRTGGDQDWFEATRAFCHAFGFVDEQGEVYCPDKGAMKLAVEALRATTEAYQGVGNCEETGENMVEVMLKVEAALAALTGKGEVE